MPHIAFSAFLSFALAGSFAVFCYERRRLIEIGAAAGLGAAYAVVYIALGGCFASYIGCSVGNLAAFAGLGAITFLCLRQFTSPDAERPSIQCTLFRACLVPVLCAVAFMALSIAAKLTPRTWDYTIYVFDRKLGIDTFLWGRWLLRRSWIYDICSFVYNAQPLFVSLTLLALKSRAQMRRFLAAAIALGIAGFFAYQICPTAGPLYRFARLFPWTTPSLSSIPHAAAQLAPYFFRNAMPSLHVGWATLCYWHVRDTNRWISRSALAVLVLTMIAAVGCGEHYFADLIVAPALVLSVHAACLLGAPRFTRFTIAIPAALVTVAWLLALRTGLPRWSPAVAWLTVGLTVFGAVAAERLLSSAPGTLRQIMMEVVNQTKLLLTINFSPISRPSSDEPADLDPPRYH